LQRRPLARVLLERLVIGGDRLLQTRRPAFALPQRLECEAEIVLRPRPGERHPLARQFLERLVIGGDRLLQTRRPAFALPSDLSALPRLFCVPAQSNGTRSRVNSLSASS